MSKRLLFGFLILALGLASAKTFTVRFYQQITIAGTQLKPGTYQCNLQNTMLTVKHYGKNVAESTVKVENARSKFDSTSISFNNASGKDRLDQIDVGGTRLKLLFNRRAS